MKFFKYLLVILTLAILASTAQAQTAAATDSAVSNGLNPENLGGVDEMLVKEAIASKNKTVTVRMWFEEVVPGVTLKTLVGFVYSYFMWPIMGILLAMSIVKPLMENNVPNYVDIVWRMSVIIIFMTGATPLANTMLTLQNAFPLLLIETLEGGSDFMKTPSVVHSSNVNSVNMEAQRYYVSKLLIHGAETRGGGGLIVDDMVMGTPARTNISSQAVKDFAMGENQGDGPLGTAMGTIIDLATTGVNAAVKETNESLGRTNSGGLYAKLKSLSLPANVTIPTIGGRKDLTRDEFAALQVTVKLGFLADCLRIYFQYDPVTREAIEAQQKAVLSGTWDPVKWASRKVSDTADSFLLGAPAEGNLTRSRIRELKGMLTEEYAKAIARAQIVRTGEFKWTKDATVVTEILGAVPSQEMSAFALVILDFCQTLASSLSKLCTQLVTTLAAWFLKIQFFLVMLTLPLYMNQSTEGAFKKSFMICVKVTLYPCIAAGLFLVWGIFCNNILLGVIGGAAGAGAVGAVASPYIFVLFLVFYCVGQVLILFASPKLATTIIDGGAIAGAMAGIAMKAGIATLMAGAVGAKIATSTIADKLNKKGGPGSAIAGGSTPGGGPGGAATDAVEGIGGGTPGGGSPGGAAPENGQIPKVRGGGDAAGLHAEREQRTNANLQKAAGGSIQATGAGVQAAGKGTEIAGKGAQLGGEAMDKAGDGMIGAGKGLMSNPYTAILGAPLAVAGYVSKGVGMATKAAGTGMEKAGAATAATGKNLKETGAAVKDPNAVAGLAQEQGKVTGTLVQGPDGRSSIKMNKASVPQQPENQNLRRAKVVSKALDAARRTGSGLMFAGKVAANLCMIPTTKEGWKHAGAGAANISAYAASKGDVNQLTKFQVSKAVINNVGNLRKDRAQVASTAPGSIIKRERPAGPTGGSGMAENARSRTQNTIHGVESLDDQVNGTTPAPKPAPRPVRPTRLNG